MARLTQAIQKRIHFNRITVATTQEAWFQFVASVFVQVYHTYAIYHLATKGCEPLFSRCFLDTNSSRGFCDVHICSNS